MPILSTSVPSKSVGGSSRNTSVVEAGRQGRDWSEGGYTEYRVPSARRGERKAATTGNWFRL